MDDPRRPPSDDEPLELPGEGANGGEPDSAPVDLPVERDISEKAAPARFELPQLSRAEWKEGRTDFRRWRLYGCLAGTLVLIALLIVGTQMVRNTVWLTFAQSHRQLVAELARLQPPDRVRTTQNLQRFTERLRAMDDPYPVIGEFQRRVREALADGRLTREEVEALDAFMTETAAPSSSQ
jgi:hypothetical protein